MTRRATRASLDVPRSRWMRGRGDTSTGVFAGDSGSSSLSAVFGVGIFLGFLLLASQVMIHLYATSTVTAVAFDGARRAASESGDCRDAAVRARAALGRWAADPSEVDITCTREAETVELRIVGPSPSVGLRIYGETTGRATIDRAARVRAEGS